MRSLIKWSAILGLCWIFAELTLRIWGFQPSYVVEIKGVAPERSRLRFTLDKNILYRLMPNQNSSINSWGYRDESFAQLNPAQKRIVVLGDSMPMGLSVKLSETFPKVLEARLQNKYRVFNLGVQGYGPDQALIAWQKDGIRLAPEIVLLSLFPGNDFIDVVKNQIFSLEPVSRKLQAHPENFVQKNLPSLRLGMLLRLISQGRFLPEEVESKLDYVFFQDPVRVLYNPNDPVRTEALALLRSILLDLKTDLAQHQVKLAALVIPSMDNIQDTSFLVRDKVPPEAYFTNESIMEALCRELDIAVVNLSDTFRRWTEDPLYLRTDRHLSPRGHALVAENVLQFLSSENILGEIS